MCKSGASNVPLAKILPDAVDGPKLTVVSFIVVVLPAELKVISPAVPAAPALMFNDWSVSVVMSICPSASEPNTLCPSIYNEPGPRYNEWNLFVSEPRLIELSTSGIIGLLSVIG